ncbi:MAG: hypothetical protein GY795_24530 [Desulfobacterales bacterium]|nr:hypothetical protein [Desulfobacterales bacterium]
MTTQLAERVTAPLPPRPAPLMVGPDDDADLAVVRHAAVRLELEDRHRLRALACALVAGTMPLQIDDRTRSLARREPALVGALQRAATKAAGSGCRGDDHLNQGA